MTTSKGKAGTASTEANLERDGVTMSLFFNRKSITGVLIALALIVGIVSTAVLHTNVAYAANAATPTKFCDRVGKSILASAGAEMHCFGAQPNGPTHAALAANPTFGTNVDAANPHEDISPSGTQAYGQSETSIAANGSYVVEAWNDATAFFSSCGAPMNKEEGTGFGFSANGGKSFVDEGGLPNTNCHNAIFEGDPSVETWRSGGSTYFYISSLFNPLFFGPKPPTDVRSFIALDACKASGAGSTATISCSQPIIAAASTECITQRFGSFCSFLDKDFLSIDPVRGRLYVSYTEFGIGTNPKLFNGQIELAVCDIGTPGGGTGPRGGTAGNPVCTPGSTGSQKTPSSAYFVVAPGDANCENEGAYPAVDRHTGAVYVAYEFNVGTNLFNPACFNTPVQQRVHYIPASCLTLPTSTCSGPAASNAVNVVAMDSAFIPGYNRFPMNDFPRIAVSDQAGTVSLVWNDARLHPAGDILLQSFSLGSLSTIQTKPVRLNSSQGGWHMLLALRYANAQGLLDVSFYGRSSANSAITDVYAAKNIDPRTTSSPTSNVRITTGSSNWNAVSSDITPNFGDYTDNYGSNTLYVAWSDGRLGDPQPFEAHTTA